MSPLLCVGFLQLQRVGATPRRGAQASRCSGFTCCRAQAPGARASVVVARGLISCGSWTLERRLSSCGARAQLLHSMWDPPGSGLEPVSPALAGGLPNTAPPGKSWSYFLYKMWDLGGNSFFGLWMCSCSSTICWKAVFSSLSYFCTFTKNYLGVFV